MEGDPGSRTRLIPDETEGVDERVKADPQVQEALRKRGIVDLDTVGCDGSSPGYFGTAEEQGRRLQRIVCSQGRGFMNWGAHPFEGLIVVWDSEEQKIIRVIDTGVVPIPPGHAEYDADSIAPREVRLAHHCHASQCMDFNWRHSGSLAELEFPLSN